MHKNIFKVVKIVSDHEIVINAGSEDFISKGQDLEIFTPGEEVIDPETKESLGTLDNIKATVEVVNLYPKMCLCMNIQYEKKKSPFDSLPILQNNEKKVIKRLNIDSTEISGGLDKEDSKIRIGDLVRKSLG